MNRRQSQIAPIADSLIEIVRSRLDEGKQVRRTLPGGGRIHMDRPLPFLCVYRDPAGEDDPGTRQLVLGEASFLIAPAAPRMRKSLSKLVETVVESMSNRFEAFLIVEVWAAPDIEVLRADEQSTLDPTELRPAFSIAARGPNTPMQTVETLSRNLKRIRYMRQSAEVVIDGVADSHPPGLPSFLSSLRYRKLKCETIGLAVRPIYRDPRSGEVFPAVLRTLRRGVGRALKQGFFHYAITRSNVTPPHFYSLGRRAMVKAVWEADRKLAEIADCFDFLLQVTPVNAEAAWQEFKSTKFEKVPQFYYRPLAVEPATLKRRLYEVPIESIEDPTLAHLFRQRQNELDRKITMLTDVGTHRFLLGSRQIYGSVDAELLSVAMDLLQRISPHARDDLGQGYVDAQGFAEYARAEIAQYRTKYPDFAAKVDVRDDIFSGLLCSGGNLLIGKQTRIPTSLIPALLQHEVGTHLLTYYNGMAAPFRQLRTGFAGYDEMQEGLAVLAEYLSGGLSRPRLRLLAARVVAAAEMVGGAGFMETFRLLEGGHGFSRRSSYIITMRTYRGGGLTKDMVYLRGLVKMLEYLRAGGELAPLFVGKIAADHIPLIQELQHRQVLKPPPLRPRYLGDDRALHRLAQLRRGLNILDLLKGQS